PDRFVLDKGTLAIQERVISVKDKVMATLAGDGAGQSGPRDAASLDDGQVVELGRLGLRVEQFFRMPCDIEWALSQGGFFLLQARAIKGAPGAGARRGSSAPPDVPAAETPQARRLACGLGAATPLSNEDLRDMEQIRQEEIASLRARAEPSGTVWSRFNLAEILPEPTPMTWAIVRRFMSGQGGFGRMYRDFGFDPDRSLDEDGIFDL